jgi:hypothetical protein
MAGGCAIAVEQRYRDFLTDRAMRSNLVVVLAPILHLFPGVFKAHEPMRVQAFGSEAVVSRLFRKLAA